MSETPNIQRGREVRGLILAVVKTAAERSSPVPRHELIGAFLGISGPTVNRHFNRLMDEGAFTVRQVGQRMYAEF